MINKLQNDDILWICGCAVLCELNSRVLSSLCLLACKKTCPMHHIMLVCCIFTGHLHGTIVGLTGQSYWSVRRSYRVNASFDRSDRRSDVWFRPTADPTVEGCGHYVRLVGPTGQLDDQSRCSVGGTCCFRHNYIAAAVIYTSGG